MVTKTQALRAKATAALEFMEERGERYSIVGVPSLLERKYLLRQLPVMAAERGLGNRYSFRPHSGIIEVYRK
jgi:hypothetical protein